MEDSIYTELTLKEKLGLLHYERGITGLSFHGHYDCATVNPSPTPKPYSVYISNVIGIDFTKFCEIEKVHILRYANQVREMAMPFVPSGLKSGIIEDALSDIVYIMTHPDNGGVIDEALVKRIDSEILKMYNGYLDIKKQDVGKYEKIEGMLVEGEAVYRRFE